MSSQPDSRQVPVVWVGLDESPIEFSNVVISQFQPGEFILTFGQVAPPPLLGTDEQKQEQMKAIDFVAVRPVCRIGLTRQRAVELIRVLQENLESHDRATGEAGRE